MDLHQILHEASTSLQGKYLNDSEGLAVGGDWQLHHNNTPMHIFLMKH